MAVLNYNFSYNTSLSCEPIKVFHGRVSYKVLDLKYGLKQQPDIQINNEIAKRNQQHTQQIVNQT